MAPGTIDRTIGLCAGCDWVREITSSRDQHFYLCRLAAVDDRFRKYPVLPVLRCDGYRPAGSQDGGGPAPTAR